jgi:capsular polysaccharide transport system permease protein
LALLDLVQELPGVRSYHELGSGLGTLPFMLTLEGLSAVGVERDERRHLTALAILKELTAQSREIEGNCRLIQGVFPDAVADLDASGSVAILTDFISSHTLEEFHRICQGLACYRYVVLDLQRFCRQRQTPAEQEELVGELERYGLIPTSRVIDLGSEGYYRLMESKLATERGDTLPAGTALRKLDSEPGEGNDLALMRARELSAQTTAAASVAILPPQPRRLKRRRFGGLLGLSALLTLGIPTLVAGIYYGLVASNQYVTTFEFAVRGPERPGNDGIGSFIGLPGAGAMIPDAFIVTNFINSEQAVEEVDHDVDLRSMFSHPDIDLWSRLGPQMTNEDLAKYWKDMVSARFDMMTGIVSVSANAFTPQESLKLANAIVTRSSEMFAQLNREAQRDLVSLSEENLVRADQRLHEARQALQSFRGTSGVVDPGKVAAENMQANLQAAGKMREELNTLKAQYASIRALSPRAPSLAALATRIKALEDQLRAAELDQPTGVPEPKQATPEAVGRYEALQLDYQFAEKLYTSALEARDKARNLAQSRQAYLALFIKPSLPQASLYPDRARSVLTVLLAAAAVWFIGVLLTYAVRDHLM